MKTQKQPAQGNRGQRISLMVIITFFFANTTMAQFNTADDLIKAHMEALGGYVAYKAIHTLTSIGTYEEPRFKEVHRFDQRRPNMVRVTTSYNEETGTFGYCEGFDGAAWEYSARVPVRVTGEPSRALRNAAEFEPSYIDYQLKGYKAIYKGKVKLKGFDLHHLQIHRSGERVDNYFFDQGTLMNNINIGNAPFHGEGKSIEILSISSDYRAVNGVMIPHRIEQKSGEKVLSKLVWDKIEANGEVADEWFSPPLSQEQLAFRNSYHHTFHHRFQLVPPSKTTGGQHDQAHVMVRIKLKLAGKTVQISTMT